MDAILEIKNLAVEFRTKAGVVRAVDDVDLEISDGEAVGIVGESGSGKSVTALSILRLIKPPGKITCGSIKFKGEELLNASEARIREIRGRHIAMIFQDPMTSLNPVYTVGEQIAEVIRLHRKLGRKEAWFKAVEALDEVAIPSPEKRAKDYPHQLSGGMRQRAMIAMALACEPDLLIADEPTTALDVTIQAQILELLSNLRKSRNLAMLLITHDLGVVAEATEKVFVMYTGRIVETAVSKDLYYDPKHPYTIGLFNSLPDTALKAGEKRRLQAIPGSIPVPINLPPGCHFYQRCQQRMDECRTNPVPFYKITESHQVRCFLYKN
ncbi:MAG TPA: ABC transporter ATP-binding protein [Pyrinomonadaceae bacterium]|nr:ABC transporter ATP-binding protein [Pyrinomonadaceae bacterium]